MSGDISAATLDATLATQLLVAWAGEGRCEPVRLGWWDTDLVDEAGGADLLRRLAPATWRWAALEAAREAARRVDAGARSRMADADAVRTIFFLGFAWDEQVADRLAELKRSGGDPATQLPFPLPLSAFSPDGLAAALAPGGPARHTVVPGGRRLAGAAPTDAATLVSKLAAGLVPLGERYPLPFFAAPT